MNNEKKSKCNIKNWIVRNKIKSIVVGLLALLFIPLIIIEVLYYLGDDRPLLLTRFKATDILSYWGAFLVGTGTISLGLLALHQNRVISKQAQEAQSRLEELEMNKVKPALNLRRSGHNGHFSNPRFQLYNRGNGAAFNVVIRDLCTNNDSEYKHVPFPESNIEELDVGKNKEMQCVYDGDRSDSKWHIGINVTYYDLNDIERQLEIELLISRNNSNQYNVDKRVFTEMKTNGEITQWES